MKNHIFYAVITLLFCYGSLNAQVKGFKTSTVKIGIAYQISPMTSSLTGERFATDGLALDIVGFDDRKATWYASLFFEEGYGPNYIDEFNYIENLRGTETYLGIKYGKGIGSILLYGILASGTYYNSESSSPDRYYEDKFLDLGAGFKSFLGKKQNFTMGAELSINKSLVISLGYLFINL
jgi:hypothetical protein